MGTILRTTESIYRYQNWKLKQTEIMKRTIQLLIIPFFIILLAFTFNACKDDCPVEPDPCSEYPEKMEITLMWINYFKGTKREIDYVPTEDTAFSIYEGIIYRTNFEYDSILWQVGNDPRVINNPSYAVTFSQEGTIKTRAICYRDTNQVCFGPNDDGIDTLYKTITMHHYTEAEILGTYRGTNDGESDSFNYRIWIDTLSTGEVNAYHAGLPKDFLGIEPLKVERFNIYSADFSSEISEEHFSGRLQADGKTIKVYWRTRTSDGQQLFYGPPRVYTGIRIGN